jgi:hypothetical protein
MKTAIAEVNCQFLDTGAEECYQESSFSFGAF